LHRGRDRSKDQSYFLWGIDRSVVARMLTPVGGLTKAETRGVARRLGLVTADKAESVEICFVPNDDYVAVLERYLEADAPALAPGPVVTTAGRVIGEHQGYARFTIGQRRGLPGGFSEPMYVVGISPSDRRVIVGTDRDLLGTRLTLEQVNWLGEPLAAGAECEVQVRYRATPVAARVTDSDATRVGLALLEPARAIAPGQSGALYAGERLLGGGVITL
jgi:tRNA-specific 2-thiouridylase